MATSTRDRLLDAAARRLGEHGYATFTLAAVRDEVGVSNGSLFHAFGSKAALAAAVYVEGMTDYQRTAMAALEQDDAVAALRAYVAAHLGWVEAHAPLARFLFATLPDEVMREVVEPLSQRNAAFFAAVDRLHTGLVDAGAMGPLDRWTAHALSIGPAQEHCRQWSRGSAALAPTALADVFADAAVAALATTTDPEGTDP
ncbi:MAG: TetR/AcrR family transcriptional regulator [Actinomycetota bacterium]